MKRQPSLLVLILIGALALPVAHAATCQTESQMPSAERDALASLARSMAGEVQQANVQGLQAETIPAVAANFGAIAASVSRLGPLLRQATITVDDLYALDASSEPPNSPHTSFYCGTRIVMLNFTNLPPGKYALAIVHATGVQKPQQISLILSEASPNHWMLAGFLSKPMIEAGHNGIWYWNQARDYAQKKMNWDAWFYYQTAANLLDPAQFLVSPNLQKLQREMDATKPPNLPGERPMTLNSNGSTFEITAVGTTTEFGGLDLEVHYNPNPGQLAQLRDPTAARTQVVNVMRAMLEAYPELRSGFHGIWVHADQGNASIFALDLPMNQIPGVGAVPSA